MCVYLLDANQRPLFHEELPDASPFNVKMIAFRLKWPRDEADLEGSLSAIGMDVNENAFERFRDLTHIRLSVRLCFLERLSTFVKHGAIP